MTRQEEPADKAADTSKSVHLSASAGSGKTRALKERFLALLALLEARGLSMDQAVAITFTDKAAAEIKERVMRDLPEAMLKKIIRGRQDLRISTIHSFCMNLLKRYPLEAGLPPDFGVLDSRDQAAKVQRAVEDSLEESDRDPGIMAPLRTFGPEELIERVSHLVSVRNRLKRLEVDAGGAEGLVRLVRSGMRTDEAETSARELISGVSWRVPLEQMELILRQQADRYTACKGSEHRELSRARDLEEAVRIAEVLAPVYFTATGSPRKSPFIPKKAFTGSRSEYEQAYARVQEQLGELRALTGRTRAGQEAVSLLRMYQAADAHYEASKRREGLLDFDDLEIHAYELLQGLDSPDILYWLDRKILHFLVDEFQDTSDIQWAILNRLTEEIFAGQGADKPVRPTLFVVGDEKQSIYRFREANHRLIEDVRRKMERNIPPGSREILTLDKNYRSAPAVIEAVNRVFGALWGDGFKPAEAVRSGQQGAVRLIELPADSGLSEAAVLAAEIRTMIGQGTVVHERTADGGWTERQAGYGDCAILIQSRTRLKEYESALQADRVPFRVVGGIGFYEEDEIQALMNTLFFLWDPDDKLSFAAALKSRLFGLTHAQLHDLMADEAGMSDRFSREHPDEWRLFREWRDLAGLAPLAGLIHRIVNDTGAYVRFGIWNPQALFNIDKLLDTAREFDRRGYTTLQDFVEWVKSVRRTEQREATADMNLPGFQGSVSIMTVHKAKGLEYPIVFLPGMNQQPRSLSTGPLAIIEERDGTVRMAVKDDAGAVYDELWEHEHEELLREHQRLLYVAMTRARDHLVMIGALNSGSRPVKEKTWCAYLRTAAPEPLPGPEHAERQGFLYAPAAGASPAPAAFTEGDRGMHGTVEAGGLKTLVRNLAPIPRSGTPEWKKATDFLDQEAYAEKLPVPAVIGPVSPLIRGSVLHRCLEAYTKTGAYDAEKIGDEYEEVLNLPPALRAQFGNDIGMALRGVLSSPEHAWIFERGERSFSELPILYRKNTTLISGVVDRVVIRDDRAIVIDYKAIRVDSDQELNAWLDHYRPQVSLYCEAIREIFGLSVVEGYLLFLDSNRLSLCAQL